MSRGYSAIGLVQPKYAANIGSVLRAAFCFDVAFIAIQAPRTSIKSVTDTYKAWRHIPVVLTNDLRSLVPYAAVPVAVELFPDAKLLPAFTHPERAFYVFGAEDQTLGPATLDWCRGVVRIPTRACLNLAAVVNIVLYDRLLKTGRELKEERV